MKIFNYIFFLSALLLQIHKVYAATGVDWLDCDMSFKNKDWTKALEFCAKVTSNKSALHATLSQMNLGQIY